MGSIIGEMFGASPFGPLLEHAKKVHGCVALIRPLAEALVEENYDEIHRLQDEVSRLEYEADKVKHEIREKLPRRYFLPVAREDLDAFLSRQDKIADAVEDFAVILLLRNTKVHPSLKDVFFEFVDKVIHVSETLVSAATEMQNLAEVSFSGAEAQKVLERLNGLGEEEWEADRLARKFSRTAYSLENEIDPVTLMFYDKIVNALGAVANAAENTGDMLRSMIVRG